jgi:hypothetical protein
MARNDVKRRGLIGKAAAAVRRLFGRSETEFDSEAMQPVTPARSAADRPMARPVRREADIPLDLLDRSYTPPLTSSKASFRSDGSDHQDDQEFAEGFADERWNDEDRYTNKSGDPRIGTHGRGHAREENRR